MHLSVEANSAVTINFLNNIERSIREFDIDRATIGIDDNDVLTLQAQANAYFISPSQLSETTKTIEPGDNKK